MKSLSCHLWWMQLMSASHLISLGTRETVVGFCLHVSAMISREAIWIVPGTTKLRKQSHRVSVEIKFYAAKIELTLTLADFSDMLCSIYLLEYFRPQAWPCNEQMQCWARMTFQFTCREEAQASASLVLPSYTWTPNSKPQCQWSFKMFSPKRFTM